ncbi:hypothetical protein EFK07_19890 [Pseudomonas putida]|uniref:Conjugal transfer protein TraK n=1 Tax=Pseudomonas putida TaxID=303 RepID=A0A3M8T5W2_PSEPU|nr:hypothetical protein [Pseudomonas putida]RNF86600.1 hypothetical protein EFK07_19890 [Pseudomonas putida]
MKKRLIAAGLCAAMSTTIFASDECNRNPRTVVYNNSPVDVYISNDTQRAEVLFPEPYLDGIYVEVTQGMDFYPSPIKNKLAFQATDPLYTGLVYVDAPSKQTYILKLITRPGCADSQVTISGQPIADRSAMARDSRGRIKGLMNYLYDGKLPSGYREQDFSRLSETDRVVFRQGSLEFKLRSQVVGPKYIGTTYEVINNGRTSTKVAIDQIDYGNKAVRESLGIARQVSMLPSSRILGPSPEYITEVYGESHRGLLFIVSEKVQ